MRCFCDFKKRFGKYLPLRRGLFYTTKKRKNWLLILAASISIVALLVAVQSNIIPDQELYAKMCDAAFLMERAITAIRDYRSSVGPPFSPDDINQTGLIGTRYSPITTTLGDLEAKRTSTNPNFAALLVYLLHQVGAQEGDAVAIGASGSFPALVIATLSACKVMGLSPVLICSLGASQWGANDPGFTWAKIEDLLIRLGIFANSFRAVALSIGGTKDIGLEMTPEGRELLLKQIDEHPGIFIYVDDLQKNKQKRIEIYYQYARERKIAAFVSIGGNWVDMGEDPAVLKLKAGLNVIEKIPESSNRGLIFEMAAQGIPVIHLLNIRELAIRYGLPWDPSPLPRPGSGYLFTRIATKPIVPFPVLASVYLVSIICLLLYWRCRS